MSTTLHQNTIDRIREKHPGPGYPVILTLEINCENSDCPARTIDILLKDHEGNLVERVSKRKSLPCPICGSRTKVHWVRTRAEAIAAEESASCASVYMQMCANKNGGFIRASEMRDLGIEAFSVTLP